MTVGVSGYKETMNRLFDWFYFGFNNTQDIIAQIIGFIPLILSCITFSQKDRKKIIMLKGCSDFLWAIHFFMLGEFSGGAINTVNTFRNIVFSQKGKKWANHIMIPIAFIIFTLVCSLVNFQGVKDILPVIGSCLAIIGFWQTNISYLRIFNLCGIVLWLIYDILKVSISAIVSCIMSIISILVGMLRMYRNKKS